MENANEVISNNIYNFTEEDCGVVTIDDSVLTEEEKECYWFDEWYKSIII